MDNTFKISGMNCMHCRASVEKAIRSVAGVEKVDVDLSTGIAQVEGNFDSEKVIEAVKLAGFEIVRK